MFRDVKIVLPLVMTIIAMSCGNKKESAKETTAKAKETVRNTPLPMQQKTAVNDETLQAIYLKYTELTDALIAGDVAKTRLSSNAIEAGAGQLAGGGNLAATAARITLAPGIEAQRNQYASLSDEMIRLIKEAGLQSGEVYVDFCPMAQNNKGGYWLSATKEIRNPYMGAKMLTCGEVKETIR